MMEARTRTRTSTRTHEEAAVLLPTPPSTPTGNMADIDIVNSYFSAFQSGQYDKLTTFFHPTFTFTDPTFPSPSPQHSRALFALYCHTMERQELALHFSPAVPAGQGGGAFRVDYTSTYCFGGGKARRVRNEVAATITLLDGKVVRHEDVFDVAAWGRQALGWWGVGMGAVGALQGVVRWWAGGWLERWCAEGGFEVAGVVGAEGGKGVIVI